MLPVVVFIVWLCAVVVLCQSRKPWRRNLGGVLGFAGGLVCCALLFHIITI
jgi:hypothetical protein